MGFLCYIKASRSQYRGGSSGWTLSFAYSQERASSPVVSEIQLLAVARRYERVRYNGSRPCRFMVGPRIARRRRPIVSYNRLRMKNSVAVHARRNDRRRLVYETPPTVASSLQRSVVIISMSTMKLPLVGKFFPMRYNDISRNLSNVSNR